jgi:hypothetical protein
MSAAPRPELELGANLGDVGRRAILELGAGLGDRRADVGYAAAGVTQCVT